ncbi:uncharacterized protein [Clytia hemisphaerica]|uniref:Uncharacterized protein n=1 Tax=Clytia hemisphaerica TaxID=252671 RepID=A0A7M5X3Z3_9CNID
MSTPNSSSPNLLTVQNKGSQLTSPVDTPDNISYRSEDDDFLYEAPKISITLLYSLLATILCFPIGCFALNNVYKVSTYLRSGRKTRARKHARFAKNLSNAGVVIGTLFWCIAIILIIIHSVILRKEDKSKVDLT